MDQPGCVWAVYCCPGASSVRSSPPFGGGILDRFGPMRPILTGAVIGVVTLVLFAVLGVHGSGVRLALIYALFPICQGLSVSNSMTNGLRSLPDDMTSRPMATPRSTPSSSSAGPSEQRWRPPSSTRQRRPIRWRERRRAPSSRSTSCWVPAWWRSSRRWACSSGREDPLVIRPDGAGAIRFREGDGRWHVGNACRVYVPSCRRVRGGCHDR